MPKSDIPFRGPEHRIPASLEGITRRQAARVAALVVGLVLLGSCGRNAKWHATNVSGSSPPLALTMARVSDGKTVTAASYRGRVVMLYFGYTYCPDICPTALLNIAHVLEKLGPDAGHVRVLFVTVDPNRDTPAALAAYVANFAPQIEGLRGTADQLTVLARRYRIAYSVTPARGDKPYEVTHSSAVYVFDRNGAARLLISSLGTSKPDIAGTVADLRRLIQD